MPEIDEISVKMSLTTENFVRDVEKAIGDSILLAEEFEDRVEQLAKSLTELAKGAGFAGLDIRADATFGELEEDLKITAGFLEEFQANAKGFGEVINAISDEFEARISQMAESLGLILPDDLEESLDDLAIAEIRASKTSEELSERLTRLSKDVIKLAMSTGPASEEFKRVGRELEKLGVIIPIKKMERFKDELIEENKAANEAGEGIQRITARMQTMGNAFLEANDGVSAGTGFLRDFAQGLGGMISKLAPAAIAIALVTKAIAAVKRIMQESIQVALQYSESTRLLTIAVLEHQRATGEQSPTIQEANAFAAELADTYGRTRLEMMELTRQALFLTKDLKLSGDETEALAESAVIMSEAFGQNAQTALRSFTNFLNTGYTQGLQSLGFSLDENSIRLEALKRGYIGLGEEMSEQIQRMTGLELITERANEVQDDVISGQDELQQNLEATNAALEEQKLRLGEELAPTWLELQVVGLKALTNIIDGLNGVGLATMLVIANLRGLGGVLLQLTSGKNLDDGFRIDAQC